MPTFVVQQFQVVSATGTVVQNRIMVNGAVTGGTLQDALTRYEATQVIGSFSQTSSPVGAGGEVLIVATYVLTPKVVGAGNLGLGSGLFSSR
jgi:hypothetical protein